MRRSKIYWLCQVFGWLGMVAIETINFTFFIVGKFNLSFFLFFLFSAFMGIVFTHGFKLILAKLNFFQRNTFTIWSGALFFTMIMSILLTTVNIGFYALLGSPLSQLLSPINLLGTIMNWMRYVGVWVIIYFMYQVLEINNELKQEKLKVEALAKSTELELLRSQLNPHFLFNALNSIKALISIDQEKSRSAIVLLGELLRFTLNYGQEKEIAIQAELQEVQKYLELEQIRFGSKLQIDWRVDEQVHNQVIPPGTILTLVENAIKHGQADAEGLLRIRVKLDLVDAEVHIEIANSGHWKPDESHPGVGIRLIQRRLEALYGGKAIFKQWSEPNWVIVHLIIPK
ncbi:sensor histidine kinase [Haliscomenobacter hydrossis]|uniref:Signal transduction histidine kinase n=1 Tax=Haliscomenobacter hydrossis (strain ATCC 27775 / DSM 1100 / LMG 10767 / O) TaxID=760192 RepID=F4L3L4_HALH1|nr:histidine kinase [Haliscomenobacter hydrossis]AEE53964.1 putative signal transduction histidine kinase [Haliscomenobacter hydrossis DSM 1100]